ncbi:MAG TPA: class I SAM-dependent methyltransferase [Actinomycetota bacterium]|nr:class I SAM-dependent methyltransferase [Actinomycetota bacterium]
MSEPPVPTSDEVRETWDANAAYWDRRMAEPDSWQQTIVFPAVERLLQLRAGERVLEIACGNGLLAQRMAEAGATVTAVDLSEEQLRFARRRVTDPAVELRRVDVGDATALQALTGAPFDAAVCSMGLMDLRDIAPLAEVLPELLRRGGRFVFSVTHPAFNSLSMVMVSERHQESNRFVTEEAVKISRYAQPQVGRGFGIEGQPEPQWYFDRSLSDLVRPFLGEGLVLDALEEPVFGSEVAERGEVRALWTRIPPILAARLRRTV